jgi:hypothetical protein
MHEETLELTVGVEVILDGALGRARDEHQAARTGGQRLFHRVLDQRLVDDGQHFLGAGLGGRQEPRAPARDRKNGDIDAAVLLLGGHMGSGY